MNRFSLALRFPSLAFATILGLTAACGSDPEDETLKPDCTPATGTDVGLELVADGLSQPVFVTSPPNDRRLFIVERTGLIRIVDRVDKQDLLLPTPFLDMTSKVMLLGQEQGLLGLVFHPDFKKNGRFFIDYTEPRTATLGRTVVGEYKISKDDPNVADPVEKRILTLDQPANNHNGGMLAFGPDGFLYIGLGDGGGGGDPNQDAQNTTTLLGSILRIDIDADNGAPYSVPSSNPFATSANGPTDPRPEIWIYGLRNPWRFSFDRKTGDLFIGDVGQGAIEEVDVLPARSAGGVNYGWDVFEADSCVEPKQPEDCTDPKFTMPDAQYTHDGVRCSVTGGYVYRGTCLPDTAGRYYYADFCSNQVFTFEYVNGQVQNLQDLGAIFGAHISSFGEDATGELYVIDLGTDTTLGSVSRVVARPPAAP